MSCAVCGGAARHKLDKGEHEIRECASCGLAWWVPEPGFQPERVYDASYFEGAEASHGYDDYAGLEASLRRSFAERLASLGGPKPGARLLDVGAAYGYAVVEATTRGWAAFGIEVSRAAAARAGHEAPGRIAVASAQGVPFPDASFDVVTAWDVLEHLPDPHAAVSELARVLRPGGRLVLTTGDVGSRVARWSGARWHLYTLPEHLFFYSRESLTRLLGAHGLRPDSMRCEASHYTLGYLVERLRKSLLGRVGGGAARWPGAGVRVPVNLFDIVTVSAVRSEEAG